MIPLAIVSEGRTEQGFVKRVLAPHLWDKGVDAVAPLVHKGRGGKVSVEVLADRMSEMARGHFGGVTSLVDLYGFVRRDKMSAGSLEVRINATVKDKLGSGFDEGAVFAYVQQYEFEALLLSDAEMARQWLEETLPQDRLPRTNSSAADALARSLLGRASPEDIDDTYETTPARRIKRAFPSYDKTVHGPLLAAHIGLKRMRARCPRFGCWLGRLEDLGARRR